MADSTDPLREARRLQRSLDRGEFLSTWQLAQESGTSPDNIRRLARLGRIPCVKTDIGRLYPTYPCLAALSREGVGS